MMTMPRRRAALAALLLVAVLVSITQFRGAPARPAAASGTATVTIDPQIGETFSPAPAGARPALTAQQAWARYARLDPRDKNDAMPANVRVRLGLLTLPVGPAGPGGAELYTARNELVYGYSWHSCPMSMSPLMQALPPNPCIQWNFLNADTGRQIDDTWQM